MSSPSAPTGISALLRGVRSASAPLPARPEGPLVWLHLPEDLPEGALPALLKKLGDVSILMTHTGEVPQGAICQPLPGPRRGSIDAFLDHWQPDVLLWGMSETGLPIVRRAKRAGIKMLFADLLGKTFLTGYKGRQLGDFLYHFDKIMLDTEELAIRLPKLDIDAVQLVPFSPLKETAETLPENEAQLRRVSGALGPRPVWCAALVSRGEVGALLGAHRHAIKAIPNLLLVVVPRAAGAVIGQCIEDEGWRLSRDCPQQLPDKQTEVILAKNAEDMGLWLRLATVSYMGGTLYGPEAANPFSAVALGSAVLCGPARAPYEARYERLSRAGALAELESAASLSAGLVMALAADRSASLALQAWEVGSEGAVSVSILARELGQYLEVGNEVT
ncbi:MAG: hypothetical protein L3J37_05940 [Rhodobacteraceae bacterium]|nr:hypothetical protein [Paracoccaceae bacterium]